MSKKTHAKRNASPAKATNGTKEGLSQEDVAARVPCAQATVSKLQRRGHLNDFVLPNGRLAEAAVEWVRARLDKKDQGEEESGDLKLRLDTAMARLREAQAQIREIELERESGRFVDLAEVERDGADCGERVVGVLRALPQRVAAVLECPCNRASVVEVKVREEVERAIAEIHDSMFVEVPQDG